MKRIRTILITLILLLVISSNCFANEKLFFRKIIENKKKETLQDVKIGFVHQVRKAGPFALIKYDVYKIRDRANHFYRTALLKKQSYSWKIVTYDNLWPTTNGLKYDGVPSRYWTSLIGRKHIDRMQPLINFEKKRSPKTIITSAYYYGPYYMCYWTDTGEMGGEGFIVYKRVGSGYKVAAGCGGMPDLKFLKMKGFSEAAANALMGRMKPEVKDVYTGRITSVTEPAGSGGFQYWSMRTSSGRTVKFMTSRISRFIGKPCLNFRVGDRVKVWLKGEEAKSVKYLGR